MFNRNKWLVNNSNYCIAHCIKNKVGRFYTVNYTEKEGVKVINLGRNNAIFYKKTRIEQVKHSILVYSINLFCLMCN